MSVTDKATLEALAITKIREHRRQMAADQHVYDEWVRASDDKSISSMVLQTMQNEYLARQEKSDELQEELSDIIDALGFVPDLPEDDGDTKLD